MYNCVCHNRVIETFVTILPHIEAKFALEQKSQLRLVPDSFLRLHTKRRIRDQNYSDYFTNPNTFNTIKE